MKHESASRFFLCVRRHEHVSQLYCRRPGRQVIVHLSTTELVLCLLPTPNLVSNRCPTDDSELGLDEWAWGEEQFPPDVKAGIQSLTEGQRVSNSVHKGTCSGEGTFVTDYDSKSRPKTNFKSLGRSKKNIKGGLPNGCGGAGDLVGARTASLRGSVLHKSLRSGRGAKVRQSVRVSRDDKGRQGLESYSLIKIPLRFCFGEEARIRF